MRHQRSGKVQSMTELSWMKSSSWRRGITSHNADETSDSQSKNAVKSLAASVVRTRSSQVLKIFFAEECEQRSERRFCCGFSHDS